MKCTDCGTDMKNTVGEHHYTESGLSNVTLMNVSKYECPKCGAMRVNIGSIDALHRAIAKSLAEKPARLIPDEVRFLRDFLELSNGEFADLMGVSQEQASRWTTKGRISATADRFLRMLAVVGPDGLAAWSQKGRKMRVEINYARVADDLHSVIAHLPRKAAEQSEVRIGVRRMGPDRWKSSDRRSN